MQKAAPEPIAEDSKRRISMSVLVVDDNPGRRSMIAGVMRDRGHRVIEAEDGNSAIELYDRHAEEIDLSIIDWILPGTDGRGVLKSILEHDSQARVIMVSGFSRDYVRSQVRMGAWGFLQKPFSTDELIREVERICKREETGNRLA
jgi:DNA-binding NtrC family response regulator